MFFTRYLEQYGEVCPIDGDIDYVEGHVECSDHSHDDGESEGEEEGVPFL
jgi:hypothetical protein